MTTADKTPKPRGTRWCSLGSWAVMAGLAVAAIGLGGVQLELITPLTAFFTFGLGVLACVLGVVLLGVGLALSKGSAGASPAARAWILLGSAGALLIAVFLLRPGSGNVPPIHDISTDIGNPPAFSEQMRALREAGGASNPPEYAGKSVGSAQREAYPDIETLSLDNPSEQVFMLARQVARQIGWEIVDTDPDSGRIEAVDTTPWFRFKDDIVIRITARGYTTYVDVRSKSRVGMSDMGTNAARIRLFLETLKRAAEEVPQELSSD